MAHGQLLESVTGEEETMVEGRFHSRAIFQLLIAARECDGEQFLRKFALAFITNTEDEDAIRCADGGRLRQMLIAEVLNQGSDEPLEDFLAAFEVDMKAVADSTEELESEGTIEEAKDG